MKTWIPVIGLCAVALTGTILLAPRSKVAQAEEKPAANTAKVGYAIGDKVDAFTLTNTAGEKITVGDWASSKATVILFVATKCPVSNAYNSRMAKLYADYSAKGIKVYGINSNKKELAPEMATHAKENLLTFPMLKDTGNVVADRFDASVTPEAYVVSPQGKLVYWGQIDNEQNEAQVTKKPLQAALTNILSGEPVAVSQSRAFGCSIKR